MSEFGIGVIGMGWMGETHSRAFGQIGERFHRSGLRTRLIMCADSDRDRAQQARSRFGYAEATQDWQDVASHPDIQVVSVAAPNFLHREIVTALAQAGKHVFCEKPVGCSVQDTVDIARAVEAAGVNSCVGFNYRWVPLVQYAHQLVQGGELGELTHYRGRFFSMYGHNPLSQLSWRFQQEQAGLGTLGDLLSHVIDMALYLAGPIVRVASLKHNFITQRPLPIPGKGTHFTLGEPDDPSGDVTNEDYVAMLVEYANGARGVLEGCRVMYGPKCDMSFDVHGTQGAVRWEFERMNELAVYKPQDKNRIGQVPDFRDGYTRILAGPEHPGFAWFQPGPGIGLGYDDLKALEAYRFLESLQGHRPHAPSIGDALHVAEVQHAAIQSWQDDSWANVVALV